MGQLRQTGFVKIKRGQGVRRLHDPSVVCFHASENENGPGDMRKAIMGYNVADVLFLEPIEEAEGRFRRVGVGNIFDPDILQCFENSEDIEFSLF